MADRGDTHYHVPHLNLWFTISSAVLLISAFWMVIDDWSRPWKTYQREFRRIETERAHAVLATESAQAALAEEERLAGALAAAESALESRRAELDPAEEELRQRRAKQFTATEAEKKAKQEYNWERWRFEEHALHHGPDPELKEALDDGYAVPYLDALDVKQKADLAVLEQEAIVAELRASITSIESQKKDATKSIDLVRKKLASLDPEDAPTMVANIVRDFPGLDFIGPNLKVAKVLPPDLTFELNFTKKPRIDMCMTCHVAIDRGGFVEDELEEPYRSHPRLDLYLTAKSPHPMSQVGCTICHRGAGEALDFIRTDHRPTDEAEGREWYDEYHWHKQHHWDYPMLSSGYVEAGCVQCHKSTMELIADDAPKVYEGYELVERYGCYACHKIDWFPTKRRPGPTLKAIASKTSREFAEAWIANPKSFRPTTWMPQIFHLENYAADDEITISEFGAGRPMMGDEWSDNAIAAVGAFLWSRTDDAPFDPIPVEGDALRGSEVFRLVGCLSCHNVAPYGDDSAESDLAMQRRDTNEHGPNLRGVATKVSREWLYHWLKDPNAYWSETRMPDLRLTDQEAADIVAFMFDGDDDSFRETPEGWTPGTIAYDREVLEEQARWFFNRQSRPELARRFAEDWKDDQVLLEVVGEKFVLQQGCHSCHEIDGLEDAMPIGTELSTWASKTVDKLDMGFIPEILAAQHGWSHREKEEWKRYREGWLEQKLREPRSYDRRKLKNPNELLKMPWFDLDEGEIEAIATFVVGLVEDEVERAAMVPDPAQASMDLGLRTIRQKNCAACHQIEPDTITWTDEDGLAHSVEGRLLELEGEVIPPPARDWEDYKQSYVGWMREEDDEFVLEELIVQLLRPEPGLGDVGETIVLEGEDVVASLSIEPGWGGDFVDLVAGHYLNPWGYDEATDEDVSLTGDPDGEGRVQDVDGEWRYYADEPYDKVRWTFAPPVLWSEGGKLQRDWFYRFLLDPVALRQQVRTRMPTFEWGEGEAGAVADYFANAANRAWPSLFARRLMLELGMGADDVAADMLAAGGAVLSADKVLAIANGDAVVTRAELPKLLEYALAKGFSMPPAVDPAYEPMAPRTPSFVEPLLDEDPGYLDRVHTLAVEGPNCFQCHFLRGVAPQAEGPIAWAPDLDITRERLRPDWVRSWLTDPSKIYPGTAMPANFPLDQSVYQELMPGASAEQIDAVLTWLFNLDRWQPSTN